MIFAININIIRLTASRGSMQQHYQVINLHNIIKTQQFKIHELREELRIANQREQSRYKNVIDNYKSKLQEKEKMISYLKEEIEKMKSSRYEELGLQRSHFERDQENTEKELINFKKKCIQLEGKLRRTENDAENRVQQMTKNFLKLSQQMSDHQKNKNYLTMQISKLNHFYKNSLFEIAKRKETLLWVQKFTEYLQNSEDKEKKTLIDVNNFVKTELETLRSHISGMMVQAIRCEKQICEKMLTSEQQIKEYLKQMDLNSEKLLEENEKFWNTVMKAEKNSEKNEEIKYLNQEIERLNKEHEKEINEYKSQAKIYETEKKTLILGFQELRSLNDHREGTYKQEIKVLKATVDELMQSGEERDRQFQMEIKTLTSQIQQISQRYYENIDFPIRKINEKITVQTEIAKKQLKSLQQDQAFVQIIKELQNMISSYTNQGPHAIDTKLVDQIQSYIVHSTTVLTTMTELIKCDSSFQATKNLSTQQTDTHRQLKQVQNRQKLNKSIYEAALAKKHLSKLQNYYQQQSDKKSHSYHHNKGEENALKNKVIELQAQNEALKQSIERIKENFQQEKCLWQKKNLAMSQQYEKQSNLQELFYETSNKMKQLNHKLESFIGSQERKFQYIQQNLKYLKKFIEKPLESLENVYRELKSMNDSSVFRERTSRYHEQTFSENRKTPVKALTEDFKNYKDILGRRSENVSSTQRLITELIKTMRQIQYKNNKILENGKSQNQPIRQEPKIIRTKGIEKKFKQIQNERIRERQQFKNKLEKLQSQLSSISGKQKKSVSLKATLNKFQINLNAKIDEVIKKMQLRLDKTEVSTIKEQVIADLRAKLSEANIENQGLRKEMSLQYTIKKQD